ncbi:MAG: hypothetical protein C0608_11380 [Deltaproteobacteria bacterium]|nr:MAG: hypothetical protein C0608_11380 [Deltaproteobacteria bacterium]
MNFHQLKVFYEAAKLLSFTKAAEVLCVSQPAVTAQIRALEEASGTKLFNKRGSRLTLSEAGVILIQYAHKVFELEFEMEMALDDFLSLKRGLLRVASTKTYARYVMPSVISKFRERYPSIKVVLDEGSSRYVCRTLLEMFNEIGVLGVSGEVEGLQFTPFKEEEVCLFASPCHPLCRDEPIHLEELTDELIIMREEGSTLHSIVMDCFKKSGLSPTVLLQTSNSDLIKEMVAKGESVAFLVKSALEEELSSGKLVLIPIKDQTMKIKVCSANLSEANLSPAAQAFLEILHLEAN